MLFRYLPNNSQCFGTRSRNGPAESLDAEALNRNVIRGLLMTSSLSSLIISQGPSRQGASLQGEGSAARLRDKAAPSSVWYWSWRPPAFMGRLGLPTLR